MSPMRSALTGFASIALGVPFAIGVSLIVIIIATFISGIPLSATLDSLSHASEFQQTLATLLIASFASSVCAGLHRFLSKHRFVRTAE
jgi:hypothetical protein